MRVGAMSVLIAASMALGGCHAKFKKYAPTLGAVNVDTMMVGGPDVYLGHVEEAGLLNAVVNVVQDVKGINQTARIGNAVIVPDLEAALESGLADSLGEGPPFAYTDAEKAPATLQVEVLRYGLSVPVLGARGDFDFNLRLRIYTEDGERVYSSGVYCATAAGNPTAMSQIIGSVNNAKLFKDMTDSEINDLFLNVSNWCGTEIVRTMRRHAG